MAESSGNAGNEEDQNGDREDRERRDGVPREALSAQELTEAATHLAIPGGPSSMWDRLAGRGCAGENLHRPSDR